MYDLSDNQWTELTPSGAGPQPAARSGMGIAFAGLGRVVMFGGQTGETKHNDTWRFCIPDDIQDTVSWQIVAEGVEISWNIPEDFADAQFSIHRDGIQIAGSVTPASPANGRINYTFQDSNVVSNRIYRYRIKESYPVMNSNIFYPEIGVPYCQ